MRSACSETTFGAEPATTSSLSPSGSSSSTQSSRSRKPSSVFSSMVSLIDRFQFTLLIPVHRLPYCSLTSHPGVVSAPLWNSEKSCFAGMLTVSDIIHLIQYYYHTSNFASAVTDVETLRLESLRGKPSSERLAHLSDPLSSDIEKALGVDTPPLLWASPDQSLYEAASLLIQTHARRLPLLDNDSDTGHEMIVSIMTQYRLLKFISINVRLPCSFDKDKDADSSRLFHFSARKKLPNFTFLSVNWGSELMSGTLRMHRRAPYHFGRWQRQRCQPPFLMSFTNSPGGVFPRYQLSTKTVSSLTSTKRSMLLYVTFPRRSCDHERAQLNGKFRLLHFL